MNAEQMDFVIRTAPVLRMLPGVDGRYPLIRFEAVEKAPPGSLPLAFEEGQTAKQLADRWSAQIKKSRPSSVFVEGVGGFSMHPFPAVSGRAAGKVAVITGAAQGFGLEIAQNLVAEGAVSILADINEAGAQKAAQELCSQYGPQRAAAVRINVTDGQSVRQAVFEAVCMYGGFDLFVSNAGVLKAQSVKSQPEKDFDFVTDVNYKGYFLCVQAAAGIFAAQRAAAPDYMADIIQINSKSGLQGSNKNAAYAGSKFGGIGLTQSFAMELIEDGVKVNSVCPGNFFDGPLWSDPENGLFVQYLRTGKIPGAKTIQDIRRAYEGKVPMRRGCTTDDVMKAIYYLIEQKYETGQAMPVTGGQAMLH